MRKANEMIALILAASLMVFLIFFADPIGSDMLAGQAMHPLYPGFALPTSGFSGIQNIAFNSTTASNTIHISSSDTITYRQAYYSLDGKSWSPVTLSGNYYSGSSIWLNGSATGSITVTPASFNLSSSRNISKNNYIVIYSCTRSGNTWDCHENSWQIRQFNATLKASTGNTQTTTNNTNTGTQTGNGGSGGNTQATTNSTTYTPSTSGRKCNTSSDCKSGEYCSNNVCLLTVSGNTYFVAVNGNDDNSGDYAHPWATWQKAFSTANAGDIIYFRGGTYKPTKRQPAPYQSDITIIAPQASIGHTGTASKPIIYENYPGEVPILDGSAIAPDNNFNQGIHIIRASYLVFRGLIVTGVMQYKDDVEAAGIVAEGCTNLRFERMVVHGIGGRCISLQPDWKYWPEQADIPSDYTYVINTDVYDCADTYRRNSGDQPGNSGDGFKSYNGYTVAGSHLVFEGCRAWNVSDDGWDAGAGLILNITNCWSFNNGYLEMGGGDGFKLGGHPTSMVFPSGTIDKNIHNTISAGNKGSGYFLLEYEDYQRSNARFYNNLAYDDNCGYWFSQSNSKYPTVLAAWRNNIAYSDPMYPFSNAYTQYTESNNNWRLVDGYPGWSVNVPVSDADFVSLDISQLKRPRKADGSLPDITFGHLAAGSKLIDAGTNVGLPYNGAAPDLGPFER